jgi:hypothetical protein
MRAWAKKTLHTREDARLAHRAAGARFFKNDGECEGD